MFCEDNITKIIIIIIIIIIVIIIIIIIIIIIKLNEANRNGSFLAVFPPLRNWFQNNYFETLCYVVRVWSFAEQMTVPLFYFLD